MLSPGVLLLVHRALPQMRNGLCRTGTSITVKTVYVRTGKALFDPRKARCVGYIITDRIHSSTVVALDVRCPMMK